MVTVAAWSRERTLNSVLNSGKLQLRLEMMRQVYGDNCLSRAQIFRWYARFKSGVETIEDEARPGHPFSVRNEGLIAKVRERIQEERCATVRMVADEFECSGTPVEEDSPCPARVLSTGYGAVGFFFRTMHRFTGQLLYKNF